MPFQIEQGKHWHLGIGRNIGCVLGSCPDCSRQPLDKTFCVGGPSGACHYKVYHRQMIILIMGILPVKISIGN